MGPTATGPGTAKAPTTKAPSATRPTTSGGADKPMTANGTADPTTTKSATTTKKTTKGDPDARPATPVWAARTGGVDATFLAFSESVVDDAPFVAHDVAGSIAHVVGLHAAGLVTRDEATALITGLQTIGKQHAAGTFALDPALEDVHMNLEAALADVAGPVAAKVHTGRSRNDQVATCLTLHARAGLAGVAAAAHQLARALHDAAALHTETPWVATTHGQPAQPATLGYLLSAHALRATQVAKEALHAFHQVDTCPLGAGAVAGSTLPLKPEVPARTLGLVPLDHALVATGTRDVVVAACAAAAGAGPAIAGLAVDLLALHAQGAYTPPASFTSGSSLMPQKRNPDALELARGIGKSLPGHLAKVFALTSDLGLGYHRDFQLTKPAQVAALHDAANALTVLTAHVRSGTFHGAPLVAAMEKPGIGATDAAEVLVAHGMPFRDAYREVAALMADIIDHGAQPAEAVAKRHFAEGIAEDVLDALRPDASRRNTRGGPAPAAVRETLARIALHLGRQAVHLAAAHAAVARADVLATTSAASLLDTAGDAS